MLKHKSLFGLLLLLISTVAYGLETPKDGLIFLGGLPSHYKLPKYHDVGLGYFGNNIIGVNKTKKGIYDWVYDQEFSSVTAALKATRKSCLAKGYKIAVASNVRVKLLEPLDSTYLFIYKYEINCW